MVFPAVSSIAKTAVILPLTRMYSRRLPRNIGVNRLTELKSERRGDLATGVGRVQLARLFFNAPLHQFESGFAIVRLNGVAA
jgi:hypothetical protein